MNRVSSARPAVLAAAVVAIAAAGCQQIKSSSPLSPAVAGPMEGIQILAPRPIEPTPGRQVKDTEQPIALVMANAESNSPRPFRMTFQIATDIGFQTVVFAQTGIAPGAEGTTRLTLPDKLQGGLTYYWRLRADDGANVSAWSDPVHFIVLQPVVIGAPILVFPGGNIRVSSVTPQFTVRNAPSSGPHGPLQYNFHISTTPTFATLFTNAWVDQNPGGETTYTMPPLPTPDRQYFWRVRVSDGENSGPWSNTEVFQSPVATGPGPGPTPPGTGGPPSTCAFSSGPAVVACIEAKYPERLVAGISLSQREANMAFLRDRIIESGRCGGLDLAWNLKRGVGPHSIDAIAWRTGGSVEVVDIGVAFDDTGIPLQLSWGIVAGPPGYDPYPAFSCN